MSEISADVLLRPTRVGFLVQPTDLAAVLRIMRICSCLWGGVYNPIIPVFKRAPKEWEPEIYRQFKGVEVAKGYVKFFEPDVYVEAQKGLAEEIGLEKLRDSNTFIKPVVTLKEFIENEKGHVWAEPAFGLNISEVLEEIYKTEQQFVKRNKHEVLYVKPERGNGVSEALFGVYPSNKSVKYIEQNFKAVYGNETVHATPETWKRVYVRGAETPLDVTRYSLDRQRNWDDDLVVYVFDPARATDLIDLWNLRLERRPVLPVPAEWFQELREDICKILKDEFRPVIGNAHGVMHNGTIEFGRSIPKETAERLIQGLEKNLPEGSLRVKFWRNAVWVEQRDSFVRHDHRLKIVSREHRAGIVFNEAQSKTATYETEAPKFAKQHRGKEWRWVNVLKITYNYKSQVAATTLPFNTFDRRWPRLGLGTEDTLISSEGWVFPQKFEHLGQFVSFMTAEEAVIGYLKHQGIKAVLSEPGHIAKQILEQLGGIGGVQLVADIETLNLLDKMAGSVRRLSNTEETVEASYEMQTATTSAWMTVMSKRNAKGALHYNLIQQLTGKNVIRIGLETKCPHCHVKNWHSLTHVDYLISCERCLKSYPFPQAEPSSKNFTYRVIGPFTARDYARGSYGAVLALRVLGQFNGSNCPMTFSTAMSLSFESKQVEVDFFAWKDESGLLPDFKKSPRLIIGESKSFGRGDLIKKEDLTKLKLVASKLGEVVVVISVLRDHFTSLEKDILCKFVKWGRRVNVHGEPTNPVILLTGNELTMDYQLSMRWKKLGGVYEKFSGYEHTRNLLNLADATQQIYLKLPSFHEARREYWEQRRARRNSKIQNSSKKRS